MITSLLELSSNFRVDQIITKTIKVLDNSFNKEEFINTLSKKEFNGLPGEKVFITNKCSIPRAKLKEVFKDKDLKITHDLSQADYVVVDRDFIDRHLLRNYNEYYAAETIQRLIDDYPTIIAKSYKRDPEEADIFNKLIVEFKKHPGQNMILAYRLNNAIQNVAGSHYRSKEERDVHIEYINSKEQELFEKIIKNPDKMIIEDKLISMTNSAIVMDDALYNSLEKYLNSADPDNVSLAIETMANCNHQSSALYILMLMMNHGYKISDNKSSKYVNFKSLMKYFNLSRWKLVHGRVDFDDIINILKDKNLLNQEHIDIITPLVFERMQQGFTFKHFRIKEIEMITPQDDKNKDDE